jgi:hypothetical protein
VSTHSQRQPCEHNDTQHSILSSGAFHSNTSLHARWPRRDAAGFFCFLSPLITICSLPLQCFTVQRAYCENCDICETTCCNIGWVAHAFGCFLVCCVLVVRMEVHVVRKVCARTTTERH